MGKIKKKTDYKNVITLIVTLIVLYVVLESIKPSIIYAAGEQQELVSSFPAKHYSALDRSEAISSETLQKYKSRLAQSLDEEVKNVTIVDYAEPSSPVSREAPFSISAIDPCGDGSNQFTSENGGVRWQTFPVTYAVDSTNSGVDATTARNAVIQTFQEFDRFIPGQAFSLINDFNAAKIKFKWEFIDGAFGQAGFASFSFTTPGLALTSATITLDSGENWFVSPVHRCSSFGNSLDIQNVASHELGHAVGLGHVSDNLLTLFPTSFAGETLKRSLGNGDILGMNFLYPGDNDNDNAWSNWNSLNGLVRQDTNPAVMKNEDGRLQVFVVGTNNQLYYKTQSAAGSSTWSSGWTSLGGPIRANTDPVVIANSDGRLQAFVIGTNNQLYYRSQTAAGSSTWSSGWTSLSGTVKADTSPAVARNNDGRLQAFVIGTDKALYYKTQSAANSNTWSSGWTSLGGILRDNSDPAVVPNNDGRLEAFVIGDNDQLYHKWQTMPSGGTWSEWFSLNGIVKLDTDEAITRNADGRLEAFVIGTNSELYHKWKTTL